ncbi:MULTISPECIES: TRAP transporter small permease [Oceanobacillus]|uniref:TRAP transporter small permease n=1 Tax=Oceanobacillus aidingensis TaxID=645964 RepID=A0ABV9JSB0_9BACI|nr:TRAP transporter small permease [Oceanobacillus oncorhynchi]UUI39886.1 TRAP transporter small permease [Oceanobacillus oncorhynchi]
MNIIRKLNEHIEEWIVVMLLVISLSAISLQMFMRYFLNNSLAWSEELARYCFIWLIYIGIAYAVKKSRHITLDIVYDLVPDTLKKIFILVSNILVGIFAVVVIYYSYFLIEQLMNYGQTSAAMRVDMVYVYLSVPIGMTLTLIRLLQNTIYIIKHWRTLSLKEEDIEGGSSL